VKSERPKSERRQRTAVVSVRFSEPELAEVQSAAGDGTVSAYIRNLATGRRQQPTPSICRRGITGTTDRISMFLAILGEDGSERWATRVQCQGGFDYCCQDGHYTPEAAAHHGAELAAAAMVAYVRSLPADTYGSAVLAKSA
jgi:hypothetical protein